jgi:hypothetical protein
MSLLSMCRRSQAAVTSGRGSWLVMAGFLQPSRNRKVGAIAFFQQGDFAKGVRRRWRTLANQHAHIEVPGALLPGIESLDESSFFGLPRAALPLFPVASSTTSSSGSRRVGKGCKAISVELHAPQLAQSITLQRHNLCEVTVARWTSIPITRGIRFRQKIDTTFG